MHREIKINYDRLEELTGKIQTYQSALACMKESVARIFEILEGCSGKAYEALLKRKDTIAKQMASCEEELEDLYSLFAGYCYDMRQIISPEDSSRMTIVDRNDIWFNMQSILNACRRLENLDYYAGTTVTDYTPFADE